MAYNWEQEEKGLPYLKHLMGQNVSTLKEKSIVASKDSVRRNSFVDTTNSFIWYTKLVVDSTYRIANNTK